MLVTPDWCRLMARYNAWQNAGVTTLVARMTDEEARRDRGAHFGGVLATLNHLLWADRVWLARLAGAEHGLGGIPTSVALTPDAASWADGRRATDADLSAWAQAATDGTLSASVTWTPASGGEPRTRPAGLLAAHLFNHQAHHRGQVHAMLTAAGLSPPPTDLVAMPA